MLLLDIYAYVAKHDFAMFCYMVLKKIREGAADISRYLGTEKGGEGRTNTRCTQTERHRSAFLGQVSMLCRNFAPAVNVNSGPILGIHGQENLAIALVNKQRGGNLQEMGSIRVEKFYHLLRCPSPRINLWEHYHVVIKINCVCGISACKGEQTNPQYVMEMHSLLLSFCREGDKPSPNISTRTNTRFVKRLDPSLACLGFCRSLYSQGQDLREPLYKRYRSRDTGAPHAYRQSASPLSTRLPS